MNQSPLTKRISRRGAGFSPQMCGCTAALTPPRIAGTTQAAETNIQGRRRSRNDTKSQYRGAVRRATGAATVGVKENTVHVFRVAEVETPRLGCPLKYSTRSIP